MNTIARPRPLRWRRAYPLQHERNHAPHTPMDGMHRTHPIHPSTHHQRFFERTSTKTNGVEEGRIENYNNDSKRRQHDDIEKREKSIRKKLEVYTEVYIVFIFVYFHVILPYLEGGHVVMWS